MAQQLINIGTTANDGTGDPIRTAFDKTNDNFTELYSGDVGIPEAPNDGKQYGRQSEAWTEVVGQVPEAPNDSDFYLRHQKGWSGLTQKEQPISGELLFDDVGGYVTGTVDSPVTNASFDIKTTGEIDGVVNMIYYSGASLPSFSLPVVNFTPNNFVADITVLLTIIKHPTQYVLFVQSPSVEGYVTTTLNSDLSYTITDADRGSIIELTNGTSATIVLPINIAAGVVVGFVNNTGGTVTFINDGTSTIDAEGFLLETAATAASVISWGGNRFQLIGKLS